MIRKILFSLVLSVSSIITVATVAKANTPCNQVSNPRPGDRCYQRVSVEARRVGYGDGISRGESSSTSIGGWFITSWNGPVSTSANNGSANLEFIQRGSDFQITNILDEYDRSLLNLRDQVQSYASFPISGVPVTVGGLTEKINQALQENERRRNYFSQARTNVDRVVVRAEASGRCTRNVLGTCVDNAGGWYSGYVDVYMVYVGSPSEVSSTRGRTLNEIQQGLRQLEQARNNSNGSSGTASGSGSTGNNSNTSAACSSSYDPRPYRPGTSGWTGRVGQIAFNNGTSSPVQVTLYHPDAPERAFNSWTVQPGQNLFLGGDNYGMDWGIQADNSSVCIVGRVSAWNQFNGQFIFQSGFPFQVHN